MSAAVGVVDLLVTQAFVLRRVVRDASVRALKGGHEVSLEGVGGVPISNRGRFVGRSVASPREWLLPAGKVKHDHHLSPTFCPSRSFYTESAAHGEHFADFVRKRFGQCGALRGLGGFPVGN